VVELDHLFILCDVGAPEAARLTDAGFVEGSANVHPGTRASPFGIVLRPGNDAGEAADPPPFASVPYRPNYLPAGVSIGIAADVALAEPAFFWLPFQRGRARLGQESTTHRLGRRITAVHVGSRPDPPRSQAALIAARASVLTCERAGEHRLDLTLDGARTNRIADLRPDLPLRFLW
jgi:hypothetical protein